VPAGSHVFSRDYDLPRTIVWDAFVDDDLIDGWLPEGTLDGEVTVLEPRKRLVFERDGGSLEFRLAEIPGGTRGTGTTVTVLVLDARAGGTEDAERMSATWHANLAQLEDLLRGHPVDWAIPVRSDGDTGTSADAVDGA
jgi:uncharacterized protein YndB with AHSA1/START domain